MSKEPNCPNGRQKCDFPEKHELAMAGSLLRMIENYAKENLIYPCPECLRNSMMAMAALLHIEAAKTGEAPSRQGPPIEHGFVESFAEVARDRILCVMDAVLERDLIAKQRIM